MPGPPDPAGPVARGGDGPVPARRAGRWPGGDAPECALTGWLFLRLLGLIYLFAFASLWPQVLGLLGRDGILPAADYVAAARDQLGPHGYLALPTLAWWDPGDGFLRGLCAAGMVLSVLLIADVLPTPALVGLWVCYLSLVNVGQDFLGFQWDVLLLEVGFLALFLSPGWRVGPEPPWRATPPSRVVVWLLRWLTFRLVFLSGVVKLASGDPSWRTLAALRYHYQTQPLPTPLAWYLHQLPAWYHAAETASVFVLELAVPFLAVAPWRRARLIGAVLLAALQVLILLTGNYGFFNLLSLALCVPLLDDGYVRRRLLPAGLPREVAPPPAEGRRSVRHVLAAPLAALVLLLGAAQLADSLLPGEGVPAPVRTLAERLEPFHVVNSYGLFAVMTTTRPEIVVEGSMDGKTWTEYPFRFKPGDVRRAPAYLWPYQPRLDWQMWFAALDAGERPPWFDGFVLRLLQGSPQVLSLLGPDPFGPGRAPRFVRALLYDYRFTDFAGRRTGGGAWWSRRPLGVYLPPVGVLPPPQASWHRLPPVRDGGPSLPARPWPRNGKSVSVPRPKETDDLAPVLAAGGPRPASEPKADEGESRLGRHCTALCLVTGSC